MFARTVVAAVIVATSISLARAEPPGLTPEMARSARPTIDYSGEILVTDVAALSLVVAASQTGRDTAAVLGWGGVLTYFFGAPIVHGAHDGRALASFGVRVGFMLPAAFIALQMAIAAEDCGHCDSGPLTVLAVGALSATAIDAFVLATDVAVPAPRKQTWHPIVTTTRHELAVGLAGNF